MAAFSRFMMLLPLVVSLALFAPATAEADPPYTTDDPEPLEFKRGNLYVASTFNRYKGGTVGTLPEVELDYGILPEVQFHVILPMAYDSPPGARAKYGLGDIETGLKIRFVKESEWMPMVGTFPLVELPSGNANDTLGNGQAQYFIPLWLQKSFGKWTIPAGGGYWVNPGKGNRDWWYWGIRPMRTISERLTLGGELIYRTAYAEDENDRLSYNLGLSFKVEGNHYLLFSGGSDINGPNHFSCYIAYQYAFDLTKKP